MVCELSEGRIPNSGATVEFFSGEGGRLSWEVVAVICSVTRLPIKLDEEEEEEDRGRGNRLVGEAEVLPVVLAVTPVSTEGWGGLVGDLSLALDT